MLFGTEITKLWAQRYRKGILPIEGAVAYVEEERSVATGLAVPRRSRSASSGRALSLVATSATYSAGAAFSGAARHLDGDC